MTSGNKLGKEKSSLESPLSPVSGFLWKYLRPTRKPARAPWKPESGVTLHNISIKISYDIVECNSKAECKDTADGVDQDDKLQEFFAAPHWFDILPTEEKTKGTADSLERKNNNNQE
uniref:Uncharacterized protein n=1 Tax=Oryza glumipatula TaxID=40148 RepID=A0A0E0A2Q5_9ORYZ